MGRAQSARLEAGSPVAARRQDEGDGATRLLDSCLAPTESRKYGGHGHDPDGGDEDEGGGRGSEVHLGYREGVLVDVQVSGHRRVTGTAIGHHEDIREGPDGDGDHRGDGVEADDAAHLGYHPLRGATPVALDHRRLQRLGRERQESRHEEDDTQHGLAPDDDGADGEEGDLRVTQPVLTEKAEPSRLQHLLRAPFLVSMALKAIPETVIEMMYGVKRTKR